METATLLRILVLEMSRHDIDILAHVEGLLEGPEPTTEVDHEYVEEAARSILQRYYWALRDKSYKTTNRTYLRQGMVDDA